MDFGLVQQMDSAEFPSGIPIYQPGTATCLDGGPATACNSDHVVQTQFPNNSDPGIDDQSDGRGGIEIYSAAEYPGLPEPGTRFQLYCLHS